MAPIMDDIYPRFFADHKYPMRMAAEIITDLISFENTSVLVGSYTPVFQEFAISNFKMNLEETYTFLEVDSGSQRSLVWAINLLGFGNRIELSFLETAYVTQVMNLMNVLEICCTRSSCLREINGTLFLLNVYFSNIFQYS